MLRVKICGITRLDDALLACDLGADAIGFIFYHKSPRYVDLTRAAEIALQLPSHVAKVGVFVDAAACEIQQSIRTVQLDALQFHGDYSMPDLQQFADYRMIKVFRVHEQFQFQDLQKFRKLTAAFLLDTYQARVYGGTGKTFNWNLAARAGVLGRVILAGGLKPENVQKAIEIARPYAVDVNSGVEIRPGEKDRQKLKMLFKNVKEYRRGWHPEPNPPFPMA